MLKRGVTFRRPGQESSLHEGARRGWRHLRATFFTFAGHWRRPDQRARWRGDFFGGTVAALIAVPYGMALAIAIGLPPEAGLYTSIIGGAIAGMISDAPVVVSGLSVTVVPVMAAMVQSHGIGAALAAGALSGLILVVIGALRLGRFFHYLPQIVIDGFTSGLGVIIVATQLKSIFGIKPSPVSFDLGVTDDLWAVLRVLEQTNLPTVAISGIVIGTMFTLPLLRVRAPASLVAIVLAAAATFLFGWQLPRIGALPDGFPLPSLAVVDFTALSDLLHPAITLAGLITINQLCTVVATDRLSEARGEVKFNRELIAQGVANIACPFFGAPPGVAMLARTAASARAGAVSRWSVFAHSAVILILLLPLRGLIGHIPVPALAAVTVAVGLQLINIERLRSLKRMARADAALFLLTFGLVVLNDLIVGVGVGSVIAMLLFVERAANSTRIEKVTLPNEVFKSAKDESEQTAAPRADIEIYRLTGPFFFASSERVLACLTRETIPKTLVLDLTRAGPIDSAATACLRQLANRQRSRGGELHLIGLDERLVASIEKDIMLNDTLAARSHDHMSHTSYPSSFKLNTLPGVAKNGSTLILDHHLNKGEK